MAEKPIVPDISDEIVDRKTALPTEIWYRFFELLEAWALANVAAAFQPLTDGAEPPTLISDGAGHLVMVPYTP